MSWCGTCSHYLLGAMVGITSRRSRRDSGRLGSGRRRRRGATSCGAIPHRIDDLARAKDRRDGRVYRRMGILATEHLDGKARPGGQADGEGVAIVVAGTRTLQ